MTPPPSLKIGKLYTSNNLATNSGIHHKGGKYGFPISIIISNGHAKTRPLSHSLHFSQILPESYSHFIVYIL